MMKLLDTQELERALAELPGWKVEGETLVKTRIFKNFVDAMQFVNAMAMVAEELNHHPDIDIRYNRVRIGLTTHDAGGITELDLRLAERLAGIKGF